MRRRLRTAACAALLAPAALAALMLSAGCTKSNADWIVDLDDPEPYARVMAAVALGRSGDPAAVPALLDALGDDSAQVSAAAGDALRALGAPAVLPLLDALRRESGASLTDKERALETLPTLGAPAVAPVVQALREGDRYDGDALVSILGRLGAPAVPALLAVLQSRDEQLASQAARALAIAGPAAAGPGGALDALATALTRPEAALRVEVARAIKAIDPTHPNALAALVRDSHDPDPEARRAVLQGAVAGLLQLLRDGNELQRRAAGLQLQDLGLAAVPALCAALKECAAEDVDGPARCLAALGVPALRETIGAFNQRNPFHVQRLGRVIELVGADALPELLAIIGERENGSRVMAASVVGALGSDAASAFPVLLSLLDEPPSSLIRFSAAYSLGYLVPPDDECLDRLMLAAAQDDEVVRLAVMPGVVNGLLARLAQHAADPPPRERFEARAAELRTLGVEALPTLRAAAAGADAALAAQARAALESQPGESASASAAQRDGAAPR